MIDATSFFLPCVEVLFILFKVALSSFYDTMGDDDDIVVHGTPQESQEVFI